MSSKSWYETLIENTPLAVIVVGLFLFIVGAAGGWPTPKLEVNESGWRVALAIMGAVVAVSGGLILWFERFKASQRNLSGIETKLSTLPQGDPGREIEGKYYAEDDRNYVNIISNISESIFKITNPVWNGVGIFDGETYCGIYKYNDKAKPEMRSVWGTHKAELRFEKKRWVLEISGTDINASSNATHWQGRWFKADD